MGMREFWEGMSGTSKQEYGEDLYDAAEYKKWRDRQEKIYGKIGAAGDRYGTQAEKFLGLYGEDRAGADKYRGLAETEFGRSRSDIDKARSVFERAEGDVEGARGQYKKATELMSDRDHYANLKSRSRARTKAGENARREMESIRSRIGKPARDRGLTQTLLDAFKRTTTSNRKIIDENARNLSRGGNQVAAAKMTQEFNEGTLKSLGQLKQKGMFSDQELSDNQLTTEAGMLMNEASLINMGATEDQITNAIHSGQIGNRLNAGNAALNAAGAMRSLGTGHLGSASASSTIGGQYGRMGSALDSRGANALNMTARYEGMKYGTLQDRMSISNKGVERQDKFRLSDAAARSRVDSFNNSRANLGIGNTLKGIRTVASVVGAGATGGGSLALEAYLRSQENKNPDPSVEYPSARELSYDYGPDPDLSYSTDDTSSGVNYNNAYRSGRMSGRQNYPVDWTV